MNFNSFEKHLCEQLIPFWNSMEDSKNGGFYGYADCKGNASEDSEKSCILNSRIMWFYSASYNLLKTPELKDKATHAYSFFKAYFCDHSYPGIFWSVNCDGSPLDMTKHTYNHAFAIYALAEYYKSTKNKEVLDIAYNLYHVIEKECRDEKGYFEAFSRDFKPVTNEKLSENGVEATRTMNTLLHVLEAYTELYRVSNDKIIADSIYEILGIFKTKVYNEENRICEVFFDSDYNKLIKLESYGHDIEASWLIERACDVLNDKKYYELMLPVIEGLAFGAYENGMDDTYSAMNNECENGIVNNTKIWWVQAEAVTGFYNAYQINPENIQFKETAEKIWDYIQTYVIDSKTGEWIENINADNTTDKDQPLVHAWKCPYHNGRMCIEMIQRLRNF